MLLGCFIVSVGILFLQNSEVITGGTAGLALSFSYLMNSSFAVVFFLINLPFYILSYFKMGWKFTASTIFAITSLSIMSEIVQFFPSFTIHPIFGSIIGGTIAGLGLSILFMNGSSLGGANILSLFLQQRFNWNPGKTMFAFDFLVILTGLYSVGLVRGFYSVLSIFVISYIISFFKVKIAARNVRPKTAVQPEPSAS
ncbi:YitT family protein [Evansella tamaricis]|nr:YitT family protein [Evansella tamaricis]